MNDRLVDAMLRHEADAQRIADLRDEYREREATQDRIRKRLTAERDAAVARADKAEQRLADERKDRFWVIKPETVDQPRRVGDLRKAIEGMPDDAQMFINVSGQGEDYAVAEVWASEQIPTGESWPTDKRTVGLEIHLGLFAEHTALDGPDGGQEPT